MNYSWLMLGDNMADNLNIKQPEDPTKININQDWELKYWANELGVGESRLIAIVKKVGPLVKDVRAEL